MNTNTPELEKSFMKSGYAEKKTFFSPKEIIFRSRGRARVFTISPRMQAVGLSLLFLIGAWSFYSYYIYNRSGAIISYKDKEIDETRNAYVQLMTDFVALNKNITEMMSSLEQKNTKAEVESYKRQASVVEDRIKQITEEKEWLSSEVISASERDELRNRLQEMEKVIKDIKAAEMEVLEKVEKIAAREIGKIKNAFNSINVPLKKNGLYFNALANSKKAASSGGPYIPAPQQRLQDEKLNDKISRIFDHVDKWEYYREVAEYVPLGKPVWSYWVTSHYGNRSDPFNGRAARHKGIDLASRTGNKIKVQAKGRVTRAEYAGGYGNLVVVDHGNGFQTKYAHMNKIYVKKGDYVEIDDTLGEVGSTGRSTGPHLHYEVLYKGRSIDPMPFIKAKIS